MIRTAKSILETRPIYHKCNETIRGHVFCSFLALLLKTELERRMKFANLQCEWAQVVRGLEALQQVEATFQDKRFLLRSQLGAPRLPRLYELPESPHPQPCASCLKTANLGENVVPKRFRTFISTNLRDTYIFAVSKIG